MVESLWFIAPGCFSWRFLPRAARLRRHSWLRVSRIRRIALEANAVATEWYWCRIQLSLGAKVALCEDYSQGLGGRKRYPESLHCIVKHEHESEPNWKEKESQPYYQAHTIGRFFDGLMDATSLLKERLQQCFGDTRTPHHVWRRFDSTWYSSHVIGFRGWNRKDDNCLWTQSQDRHPRYCQ